MPTNSQPPVQPAKVDKSQDARALFDEIQNAAKEKKFKYAEELRKQLISLYPMAFTEIVKSSSIIEAEKTAGIDASHLALWANLYDSLNEEERNCIYYCLKKFVVPPKKMLLKYGATNNRLFFIESGQVTTFVPKSGKNIVLAQLEGGEILGEHAFTVIALCPISAITGSEVQLYCLERDATDDWEESYPDLLTKLVSFCKHNGRTDRILQKKSMEPRQQKKILADGDVTAILLTEEGQKSQHVFHGKLSDISPIGTCFTVPDLKERTARALLAKSFHLTIAWMRSDGEVKFSPSGRVESVSCGFNDVYSLHVRFTEPQPEQLFSRVITRIL